MLGEKRHAGAVRVSKVPLCAARAAVRGSSRSAAQDAQRLKRWVVRGCRLRSYASGVPEPLDVNLLQNYGSVFLTRPTLWDYIATKEELDARAEEVFRWVAQGKVELRICEAMPLSEAARAQAQLQARSSTGKYLLIP